MSKIVNALARDLVRAQTETEMRRAALRLAQTQLDPALQQYDAARTAYIQAIRDEETIREAIASESLARSNFEEWTEMVRGGASPCEAAAVVSEKRGTDA